MGKSTGTSTFHSTVGICNDRSETIRKSVTYGASLSRSEQEANMNSGADNQQYALYCAQAMEYD